MLNKEMLIFDLDGTVIDSHHRVVKALATGEFCLETYLAECNTPELIAKDTLLPLATFMQDLASKGTPFAVITARYLTAVDTQFLRDHKLVSYNTILLGRESVTKEIRALSDAMYKVHQIKLLQSHFRSYSYFTLFDDKADICEAINALPFCSAIDAVSLNKVLANQSELIQHQDTIKAYQSFASEPVIADLFAC